MDEKTTDPLAEVTAMQKVAEALADLDMAAIARIIRWAADRFKIAAVSHGPSVVSDKTGLGLEHRDTAFESQREYADLADLYHAASPTSDIDRALVAAYWFQYSQGKADFVSQEINAALKDLGHGIGNITDAFDALMTRKPALVIQLKKAGTTKQARKKYKLTVTGKSAVEQMIDNANE